MKPIRRKAVPEPTKPGPRARDADRDEVVEELQAAFVDGQLDADERERRTELALSATHLVDLEPLTADLQVAPKPVVLAPATEPQTLTPARKRRSKAKQLRSSTSGEGMPLGARIGIGVAIASVLVAGAGIAFGSGVFNGGGEDTDYASLADQPTTQWSEVRDQLPAAAKNDKPLTIRGLERWTVTRENVKALLAGYRQQLGTPYFRRLALYPDWASIERPVAGTNPTLETWTFDETGEFARSEVNLDDGKMPLLNVGDLDVNRLFDNIDWAFDRLDSENARLLYVTVDLKQGDPAVEIFVADKYDITVSGYVTTTLSGKVHRGSFVS